MHILAKNRKSSAVNFDLPVLFMSDEISERVDIIRWGVTSTHPYYNEVLQPRDGIALAADKPACRSALLEAGIPCPKIIDTLNPEYPLIARLPKHRMGKKFYYCENERDLARAARRDATYLQEYIDKDREYRVHVFLNKVLVVQEKAGSNSEAKNWNHSNGFIFEVLGWNDIPRGICELAVNSIKVIGLHFGAVDIILKDDNFYVLEINTAPGLEGYTLDRYNMAFKYISENGVKEFQFNKKYMIRKEELIGNSSSSDS